MKPILYSYWRSSCSYRVRIAMEYKNISYEYIPINLIQGENGQQNEEQYFHLNPKKEVPLLVDGDNKLAQSMAILFYLEHKWKNRSLFPEDPIKKSKVIQLCEIINSGIQPFQNLSLLKQLSGTFNATDEQKFQWCRYWINRGFVALEKELELTAGNFSMGNDFSAVDVFLIPQVYNAKRFKMDLNEFPVLAKIESKCMELDFVKKASPEQQPDSP